MMTATHTCFLVHDEDNEFHEAAIILFFNNLDKKGDNDGNDFDDTHHLVPPFVWGSTSRVGKAT